MDVMSKNIYVYPYDICEVKSDQIVSYVNNVEGLRNGLLFYNQNERESKYSGWNPEDYTIKNIAEFNKEFDETVTFIINTDLEGLLKYIDVKNITLTTVNPLTLTYNDFENPNNPEILTKEEIVKLVSGKVAAL